MDSPRLGQVAVQVSERSGKKRRMFTPRFLGAPGRGTLPALGALTASKSQPNVQQSGDHTIRFSTSTHSFKLFFLSVLHNKPKQIKE